MLGLALHEYFVQDRSMKSGPDIARIANLIGDPARANMLDALMGGQALTASELADVAGIGAPTASVHLARLEDGGLVSQTKQGRHRYFSIADEHVSSLLETMLGLAERLGHNRVRTGPKEPALRQARVCYNHLAGEQGVRLYDSMIKRKLLAFDEDHLSLTPKGEKFAITFGIDVEGLKSQRRPLCKCCLDWSVRRNHLAGSLGSAMLDQMVKLKWAKRDLESRAIHFSVSGAKHFEEILA
jgi:DNA-binding transcriptional ArsR family regulator